MSVRRLAEEKVQPKSFAFNRKLAAESKVWIKKYPKGREQSAVIPLLMLVQEQEGWVTKPAIEHVAGMLDMAYIRVLEVATFYTQFQLAPVGTKAHVQICGTTPCMLRGSEALMDVCRSKIHHDQFHLNDKGTLSWEEVECLGACVNAPMAMVFKDTYEDLTPERLAEIIDEFEAGKDVRTGPQIKRVFSAPASGYTTLQDKKAISKAERQRLAKEYAKETAIKVAAAAAAPAAVVAVPTKPTPAPAAAKPAVASHDLRALSGANDVSSTPSTPSPKSAPVASSSMPIMGTPAVNSNTHASAQANPGALLRDARVARGMSVTDVASRLRMGNRQVAALEAGQFEELPEGTFLRGFARNFSKVVGADTAAVLAALEAVNPDAAAPSTGIAPPA